MLALPKHGPPGRCPHLTVFARAVLCAWSIFSNGPTLDYGPRFWFLRSIEACKRALTVPHPSPAAHESLEAEMELHKNKITAQQGRGSIPTGPPSAPPPRTGTESLPCAGGFLGVRNSRHIPGVRLTPGPFPKGNGNVAIVP